MGRREKSLIIFTFNRIEEKWKSIFSQLVLIACKRWFFEKKNHLSKKKIFLSSIDKEFDEFYTTTTYNCINQLEVLSWEENRFQKIVAKDPIKNFKSSSWHYHEFTITGIATI